jgi:hypothetical protein
MPITHWAPNQAYIKQVETYTFTAPSGVGNTYIATINGKSVTYSSVSGDTATTVATALYNLLNASDSLASELTEIAFTNPSAGVVVATARTAGTPFANVPGTSAGLVMSTGNGLSGGIATAHTTANRSPSDVNDSQNWLRVIAPAPGVRSLPQNGDDVVVAESSVPMLWNLDQLAAVQFNTYTRWQSFTGTIGLPEFNSNGYTEWRATYFKFVGPQGSVPAGGLIMVLGFDSGSGSGPGRERYNLGSQKTTLTLMATGSPEDDYSVRFLGVHTLNTFSLLGGVSLGIATSPGEIAGVASSSVNGGTLGIGAGVVWTAASTLTMYGGSVLLNSAPATLSLNNGANATVATDALTWATVTAQGSSRLDMVAGGTITTLTLTTSSILDKSGDTRALTVTNSTIDGDSCLVLDPYNAITWTNPTTVKQQVVSGPFTFTGPRTVRVQ